MKDKDFELTTEPKPIHEWRVEPQGYFDWYNVTNGVGGYVVQGKDFANMLLQEIKLTQDPEIRQPETPIV